MAKASGGDAGLVSGSHPGGRLQACGTRHTNRAEPFRRRQHIPLEKLVKTIDECRDGRVRPAAQIRFFESILKDITLAAAEQDRAYDQISTEDLERIQKETLLTVLSAIPTY